MSFKEVNKNQIITAIFFKRNYFTLMKNHLLFWVHFSPIQTACNYNDYKIIKESFLTRFFDTFFHFAFLAKSPVLAKNTILKGRNYFIISTTIVECLPIKNLDI